MTPTPPLPVEDADVAAALEALELIDQWLPPMGMTSFPEKPIKPGQANALHQAVRNIKADLDRLAARLRWYERLQGELSDADFAAVREVLGTGFTLETRLSGLASLDRLSARLQEAERERDELRAWKTATHEQWAAWTRDDFKARADAAEAREAALQRQLDAVDKHLPPWETEPGSKTGCVGRVQTILNLKADRLSYHIARAALTTADPEATE